VVNIPFILWHLHLAGHCQLVILINFEIKAFERTSQLFLGTTSEINGDGFEIERSNLGKSWQYLHKECQLFNSKLFIL
jgi:hypothetical protein